MIRARKAVREVHAYPLHAGTRKDKIRLDLNESCWGCSPKVLQALQNIPGLEVAAYPDYYAFLENLGRHLGLTPANLLITNGADDAIRTVMQTFVNEGEEVLLAAPGFGMIDIHARVVGARVVEVAYEHSLAYPASGFLRKLSASTRLIALVRPDSPSGAVITRAELLNILQQAPEALVLLDETYTHFLGENCIDLLPEYPNLIILQSFSKAYGLAGLRIGVVAAAADHIGQLRKVSPPFSVNGLAVIAATAALEDQAFLQRVCREMAVEKAFLEQQLTAMGFAIRGAAANFLLVEVGAEAERLHAGLLRSGILVKNLHRLPHLAGCFRIAIAQRRENELLLQAFRELCRTPRAILFDMDGVLVDESHSCRAAIRLTASHFLGETVPPEAVEELKRRGGFNNDWDATCALLEERGKAVPREEVVRHFQQIYLGTAYDGLIANETWLPRASLLPDLAQHYALGVVTGRPRAEAQHVLQKQGLEALITVLIAMEDMGARQKPHPAGILQALEQLGEKQAWYLGDSIDDMRAATAAGIRAIGVLPPQAAGNQSWAAQLREHGALAILNSINEIDGILT